MGVRRFGSYQSQNHSEKDILSECLVDNYDPTALRKIRWAIVIGFVVSFAASLVLSVLQASFEKTP
jgi:hypothetical protein